MLRGGWAHCYLNRLKLSILSIHPMHFDPDPAVGLTQIHKCLQDQDLQKQFSGIPLVLSCKHFNILK